MQVNEGLRLWRGVSDAAKATAVEFALLEIERACRPHWDSFSESLRFAHDPGDIPDRRESSVYFLARDRCVQYIGATHNLYRRIRGHWIQGRLFDAVVYLPITNQSRVTKYESQFIYWLKPPGNRRIPAKDPEIFTAGFSG